MENTNKRSIVKTALVTPTTTQGEYQMGEIITPTDDYGCVFESIEKMHQFILEAVLAEKIEKVDLSIQNQKGDCYKYTYMSDGISLECAWVDEDDLPPDIYETDFKIRFAGESHRGDWRDALDVAYGDYNSFQIGEAGISATHIRTGKEVWPRLAGESDYAMVARIFQTADNAQDLLVRTSQGRWVTA